MALSIYVCMYVSMYILSFLSPHSIIVNNDQLEYIQVTYKSRNMLTLYCFLHCCLVKAGDLYNKLLSNYVNKYCIR